MEFSETCSLKYVTNMYISSHPEQDLEVVAQFHKINYFHEMPYWCLTPLGNLWLEKHYRGVFFKVPGTCAELSVIQPMSSHRLL
jgi:hypothetical protein